MGLPKAYNIETKSNLSSEEAVNLFVGGVIKSPQNFKCPSCEGQVTLANPRGNCYQKSHFRCYSHNDGCSDFKVEIGSGKSSSNRSSVKAASAIHRFLPTLASYEDCSGLSTKGDDIELIGAAKAAGAIADGSSEGVSDFRKLITLVRQFEKPDRNRDIKLQFEGLDYGYDDFFISINSQLLDELPLERRVYHGEAFIDYKERCESYQCHFTSTFVANEKKIRPKILIPGDEINRIHMDREVREKISAKGVRVYVYVFSVPPKLEESKSMPGMHFINFKAIDPAFVVFREIQIP